MPSFWTHVSFAEDCKKRLFEHDSNGIGHLTNAIRCYPHAFYTGMQGPDLFLFYIPAVIRKHKLSSILHTRQTDQLLYKLFCRAYAFQGEERLCALSYLTGFLGHYLLDSYTHPYVYAIAGTARTAKSFCTHTALESDLNGLVVKRSLGCALSVLPRPCSYALDKSERRILSLLLSSALYDVYGIQCSLQTVSRAFHSVNLLTRLLYDPNGTKARIAQIIESPLRKRYLSPFFLGESHYFTDPANLRQQEWTDPFTGQCSTDSFFTLYDQALKKFVPTLCRLDFPVSPSSSAISAFFRTLCRRDFHGEPNQF